MALRRAESADWPFALLQKSPDGYQKGRQIKRAKELDPLDRKDRHHCEYADDERDDQQRQPRE
ncbi:hypothetical protein D3C87_962580 [compost metagenome]